MITAFYDVFDSKLGKLKKELRDLLSVPKKQRNRARIKRLIAEAKSLRKTLRSMHREKSTVCPQCGHKF